MDTLLVRNKKTPDREVRGFKVALAGIEPATQRFSVVCSTN